MTSPDYIRGKRDGMEGAISTVKLALEDCQQWDPVCPHAEACIGALTAEAAKLPEAASVASHEEALMRDKQPCLECARVEARATAAETALAAMTERCRVLVDGLKHLDDMIFYDPQIIERADEMRKVIAAMLTAERGEG